MSPRRLHRYVGGEMPPKQWWGGGAVIGVQSQQFLWLLEERTREGSDT